MCAVVFPRILICGYSTRGFRKVCGREPPTKMSIYKWHKLSSRRCICNRQSPSRCPVTEGQTDTVGAAFACRPYKPTWQAVRPTANSPHTTAQKILRKRLKPKCCKYQLLRHVTALDYETCYIFCSDLLLRLDELFTAKTAFNDKATFHLSEFLSRETENICGGGGGVTILTAYSGDDRSEAWALKTCTLHSGFESRLRHGRLSFVYAMSSWAAIGLVTSWSLVQRAIPYVKKIIRKA
jgi:hypothetical protein